MAADSGQCIDKGGIGFGIPGGLPCWQMIGVEGMGHENYKAEQSQQAGSGPCNRKCTPLSLRFQAEMGADFFQGHLDVPAADVLSHDLEHGDSRVRTEESKRRALATWVVQENPADGQWVFSVAMP